MKQYFTCNIIHFHLRPKLLLVLMLLLILILVSGCSKPITPGETPEPKEDNIFQNEPVLVQTDIRGTIFERDLNAAIFTVIHVGELINNWTKIVVNATSLGFRVSLIDSSNLTTSRLLDEGGVKISEMGMYNIEAGQIISFCNVFSNENEGWFYLHYPQKNQWNERFGSGFPNIPQCE